MTLNEPRHIPKLKENAIPLDSYVTLGRSGLRVSPICLGGMTFGKDNGWGSSVADSETIISKYLDGGGNFIDTANIYTADLRLTPAQIAALDAVSKPVLTFPADFNTTMSPNFEHAGATVNGVPSKLGANVPVNGNARW